MMFLFSRILLLIMFLGFSARASIGANHGQTGRVKCSVEIMPNYLWHLFAQKYATDSADVKSISQYKGSPQIFQILDSIGSIIQRNYPAYEREVWNEVNPVLQLEKQKMEEALAGNRLIEKWEKALNMKYTCNRFTAVLTYANAVDHLPSANNLSTCRNNFGVLPEYRDYTLDLLVHEVGIYILMPTIRSLMIDPALNTPFNRENGVLYQAVESYVEKTKADITGNSKTWNGEMFGGGEFDFPWFFDYYDKQDESLSPSQLIRQAAIDYEKYHHDR